MIDVAGRPLSEGDIVSFINTGHKGRSKLRLGRVLGFTEKKIRIEARGPYSNRESLFVDSRVQLKFPDQVTKILSGLQGAF